MNKKYFLGIIVELSQAFNMTDHKILIKKLEKYEICGRNLLWLKVIFQTENNILDIKMISVSRNLWVYCN